MTARRAAVIVATIFAAATLALLLAFFAFAVPTGDDFCKAMRGRDGWLAGAVHAYTRYGGRWSTNLLQSFVFLRVPLVEAYGWLLAAVWAIHLAAVYALLRVALRRRDAAVPSLLFGLLCWVVIGPAGDSLFWLTGSVEYFFALSVALLLFACLLAGDPRWRWAAPLLAIYVGGAHELVAMASIAVAAAGAWAWRRKGDACWRWWLGAAVLLAALVAVQVSSPGAGVRAARAGTGNSVLVATLVGAARAAFYLPRWLLQAPVLLALVWVLTSRRMTDAAAAWGRPGVWTLIRGGLLTAAVAAMTIFVTSVALDGNFPARVAALACVELLLGLLALAAAAGHVWDVPSLVPERLRGGWSGGLAVALCAALFFSPVCLAALAEMRQLPEWRRAGLARFADLRAQAAAGVRNGVALPVPPVPSTYFGYVLGPDPQGKQNRCVAGYYGFETVTTAAPR